jgi:AraC-like DNA-binding protein
MFEKTHRFPFFDYRNKAIVLPYMIGHEWVDSETYCWDNKRHSRSVANLCFIQYTLSGAGKICFKGRAINIKPGMGFICRPAHPYRYWFDAQTADRWEFLWLGLTGEMSSNLLAAIQKEFGKTFSLSLQSLSIQMLLDIHRRTEKTEWKSQMQTSSAIYQFLLQLIEDLRHRGAQDVHERLEMALTYFQEHFRESLDISRLSPRFGYSREHFTRLFRRKIGITPAQYLLSLRIERAKELLCKTQLTLDAIAVESGLQNANYLCRLFKHKLGLTSREYKRSFDAEIHA